MAADRAVDDFAKVLMSSERLVWQDPDSIVRSLGVRKGMKVADIGCGPGYFTIPLARAVGDSGLVYAVDENARMLSHLMTNIEKSGFRGRVVAIHADGSDTGIMSDSLDFVLFANVLHDIEDKPLFLAEVKRIVAPTGRAVDVDWSEEQAGMGPPVAIRLSEDEAGRLLERSGLRVTKTTDAGPYHYGLISQKS